MSLILISYDIEDDRRRHQVSKTLEGYGERVQKSVFECLLEPAQLAEAQARLSRIVDSADSVRYYMLCGSCAKTIAIQGAGTVTQDEGYYMV